MSERRVDAYGYDKPTNICGLWENRGGNGMSTNLSDRTLDQAIEALQAQRALPQDQRGRLTVWSNKFKQGDRDPTHKMVILPPRPAQRPPAGVLPGAPSGTSEPDF